MELYHQRYSSSLIGQFEYKVICKAPQSSAEDLFFLLQNPYFYNLLCQVIICPTFYTTLLQQEMISLIIHSYYGNFPLGMGWDGMGVEQTMGYLVTSYFKGAKVTGGQLAQCL